MQEDTEGTALYIGWMLQTKNNKRRQLGYKRFDRMLRTEELRQELQELYDTVDLDDDLISEEDRQEYRRMFLLPLTLPTLNYKNFQINTMCIKL